MLLKMKNDDEDTTYEEKMLCRNCETEWIEKIEKGIYIRYEKDNNYMIKPDNPSKKILFKCPKCGAQTKIARLQ
jgi:hypothetical protein